MPKNLPGKTYEVLTADGKRWLIESEHATRSAALEHAGSLLTAGNHKRTSPEPAQPTLVPALDNHRRKAYVLFMFYHGHCSWTL